MIKKSLRTKEKYAKASAELDALESCLFKAKNLKELLPAKEIDYLINLHDKISLYRVMLDNQACKDFASTRLKDGEDILELFYNPSAKENNEHYQTRLKELLHFIRRRLHEH